MAERISALDILSNGRVEFGSGESASEMELGGFGVERGLKKAMWEEATREITNMMVQTPYAGFEGEFFSMPGRNVVPKPLQKPHPPIGISGLSPKSDTLRWAGEQGFIPMSLNLNANYLSGHWETVEAGAASAGGGVEGRPRAGRPGRRPGR